MAIRPYLILMRPANLVTAVADILAGASIAGLTLATFQSAEAINIMYLMLATIGLYGGGVVFNDVFDYELDKVERPERPLPSGQVSRTSATIQALALYIIGIVLASLVSPVSGLIAVVTAIGATVYDKWAKHHTFFGPLVMGTCRGLNLLLGVSISLPVLYTMWPIAILPIIFIGAITLTSQGEVVGNNRKAVALAMSIDAVVVILLAGLAVYGYINWMTLIPFIALWWGMNLFAKIKAYKVNEPKFIMKAVKMGVLSLIPLNACYAAGFSSWQLAVAILCLLPISLFLSKYFAVT